MERQSEEVPFIPEHNIKQLIDRVIEPFGRYQKLLLFLLALADIIAACQEALPVFHAYTPKNYACIEDDFKEEPQNQTCVPGCKEYEFFDNRTSPVTEWSLVCDKRYLSPLLGTIYYTGVTFGTLTCGFLSDKFGRKRVLDVVVILLVVLTIPKYFSPYFGTFMFFRFVQGLCAEGILNVSFTLQQELTPARLLTFTGFFRDVSFLTGDVLVAVVSYFVHDWRKMLFYVAIPSVLSMITLWILPESPSWYLSVNKDAQAFVEVKKISRWNGGKAMPMQLELSTFEGPKSRPSVSAHVDEVEKSESFTILFTNRILRRHLLVMLVVFFVFNFLCYGFLFYMPNLPGTLQINLMFSSVIELVACIVAYYMLSSPLGRRYSMILFACFGTIFCAILGGLTFVNGNESWEFYTVIAIAIVGRSCISAGHGAMFIYGVELFPASVRGSAIGICGFLGKIGSLIAPQIIYLGEVSHPVIPMAAMAIGGLLSAISLCFVPETMNKSLPNTLQDAIDVWGSKANLSE